MKTPGAKAVRILAVPVLILSLMLVAPAASPADEYGLAGCGVVNVTLAPGLLWRFQEVTCHSGEVLASSPTLVSVGQVYMREYQICHPPKCDVTMTGPGPVGKPAKFTFRVRQECCKAVPPELRVFPLDSGRMEHRVGRGGGGGGPMAAHVTVTKVEVNPTQ